MDELDLEMKLHALLDGELSPEDTHKLERRLEASPALRDHVNEIQATQALLREGMNAWAAPIPGEAMWSAIERDLAHTDQHRAGESEHGTGSAKNSPSALTLIDGQGGDSAKAAAKNPPKQSKAWTGWRSGVTMAAAAAILLTLLVEEWSPEMIQAPEGSTSETEGESATDATEAPGNKPPAEPNNIDARANSVLAFDFGGHDAAILSVDANKGQRYAVVWLKDEIPSGTLRPQSANGFHRHEEDSLP